MNKRLIPRFLYPLYCCVKKNSLFIIFSFTFCCCTVKEALEDSKTPTNTIRLTPDEFVQEIKLSDFISSIDYVQLETNEDNLIGNISQLLSYKDQFYIVDKDITKAVYCFAKDGRYLFKIDRQGHGPGEYTSIRSVCVNSGKDRLALLCDDKNVLVFDNQGNFIESHRLDFYASEIACLSDGQYAFSCDYNTSNTHLEEEGALPNLIITDSAFKRKAKALPFSSKCNFSAITSLSCCFANVEKNRVSMVLPYNDTIYYLSPGKIERTLVDFGKYKKEKAFYSLIQNKETPVDGLIGFLSENKMGNLFHWVESAHTISFIYSIQSNYHYAIYDKERRILADGRINYGEMGLAYPVKNTIDGAPFFPPYFSDTECLYSQLSPEYLADNSDEIRKQLSMECKLHAILDNISYDDNPVIIVMKPIE